MSPESSPNEVSLNKTSIGKNGIKLHARLIEERDIDIIVQIVNWAYRGKGDIETWTTEKGLVTGPRLTEAMLKEDLAKSEKVMRLMLLEHIITDGANEKRHVVGCVKIDRETEESPDAVLGMLSVDPEYQGKGVGGVLVKLAESEMRNWKNCKESHLHVVNCRDELLSWYRSIGYESTSQTFPFIVKDNTALKDIHFVLLIKKL
ncbi:hypothetical protein DICPUDRAFT_33709 [Dictyostelium purpureum]|uniref:N-acetyltransferase domain-containing protein n=1 Tax=Dictyostelium purpureum TaxID=5786 RepID=F0ZLC8_DICPU|nr:uncharacterized protein DICPUDRAFT_33709 [Dictyostelium purpureum]EGC35234.1 hypothetical protein DICPUDRAFT_33709 [Dictyostelium purpureum]|eukprot:XP_003288221.1 hypothetical protein DICPUDRAFT_33709 [Dictyostelium purpureum]